MKGELKTRFSIVNIGVLQALSDPTGRESTKLVQTLPAPACLGKIIPLNEKKINSKPKSVSLKNTYNDS